MINLWPGGSIGPEQYRRIDPGFKNLELEPVHAMLLQGRVLRHRVRQQAATGILKG